MRESLLFLSVLVFCAVPSPAAIDFSALGDNDWVQQATSGDGPSFGGDVHWAIDTAGYAYMFGGCTYGGTAGGTHNNDVYRFNLLTGYADHLSSCGSNTLDYMGGCQAPHCYDSKRNCIWTSQGFSSVCGVGQTGLLKFQCPDGPLTKINTQGGGHYFCYDPINDLIYQPSSYDNGLNIYNPDSNTWSNVQYPANSHGLESFAAPCCVDTRRGLFLMTLWSNYGETEFVSDVWIFNGATRQWEVRSPDPHPLTYNKEFAYDSKNDKCVLFGAGPDNCISEVWAYDYAANTWTQSALDGRSYNDADKPASTWPPAKHYMTWAYCEKYNAFASWGGGCWINDASCTDYGDWAQPLWIYRLKADSSTRIVGSSIRLAVKAAPDIFPNPFRSSVVIRFPADYAGNGCSVYDIKGRLIRHFTPSEGNILLWNAENAAAGVYLLKTGNGDRYYLNKLLLER